MAESLDSTGLTARRSLAWQLNGADRRRLNGTTLSNGAGLGFGPQPDDSGQWVDDFPAPGLDSWTDGWAAH